MEIKVGETYWYGDRPVVVIRVQGDMVLVRGGNDSKKLDYWVSKNELH